MDVEHTARHANTSELCSEMTQGGTESFNEVKCEGVGFDSFWIIRSLLFL